MALFYKALILLICLIGVVAFFWNAAQEEPPLSKLHFVLGYVAISPVGYWLWNRSQRAQYGDDDEESD